MEEGSNKKPTKATVLVPDTVETVGHSTLQHGPLNDRVYLMKLADEDEVSHILDYIDNLVKVGGYGKIIAKIPSNRKFYFLSSGFEAEAEITYGLPEKEGDVTFVGKYFNESRKFVDKDTWDRILHYVELAKAKGTESEKEESDADECEICGINDAEEIAKVYEEVFPSYPFPISDPEYIKEAMLSGSVVYFAVRRTANESESEREIKNESEKDKKRRIVSLSAAEMDLDSKKVEMTDFATLPAWRGQGLASKLLVRMGKECKGRYGIRKAFTIARALSLPMNCTFAKGGYTYSGTLRNNTNISGAIECMNVWHKLL